MSTIVDRPVSIGELCRLFRMSRYDLSLALDAMGVRPAFRIGTKQVGCYVPEQVAELWDRLANGGPRAAMA